MGQLRHRGIDRGVDLWWLPDGARFKGTKEEAEIAAGLRKPAEPAPVEPSEPKPKTIAQMNLHELRALCTEKGIEFKEENTKAELRKLLEPAPVEPSEPSEPSDPAAVAAAKAKAEAKEDPES